MKAEEIIEIIMTQHWDMAACRCWICEAGRRAGCRASEKYLAERKRYGRVTVEKLNAESQ